MMSDELIDFAVHAIYERVGLVTIARRITIGGYEGLEIQPIDGHPNETFLIKMVMGYRRVEVLLELGRFAASMVSSMGRASTFQRDSYNLLARALKQRALGIFMQVNGVEVDPCDFNTWPANWAKLELRFRIVHLVVNPSNAPEAERFILDMVVPMFAMVSSLIGIEESEIGIEGEHEGVAIETSGVKYERSRLNRETCILLKGDRCSCCGFDFLETYGILGLGFVEIHHVIPSSQLGPDYQINIETDLVPLCSNCHSMIHRQTPPISISSLYQIVQSRKDAKLSGGPS